MMRDTAILWPAIALVALTYAVWFKLFRDRIGLLKASPPKPEQLATGAAAMHYFAPVEMPANNLRNLTEMPVLFYALVGLLFTTGLVSAEQVWLGWAYVLLRAAHSWEHLFGGRIGRRFGFYLTSCAVLLAMWIGFAVDLAQTR